MQTLRKLLGLIQNDGRLVLGELGCREGESTSVIAEWLRNERQGNGYLHVIDWFRGSPDGEGYVVPPDNDGMMLVRFRDRMRPWLTLYSLDQMESGEASKQYPNGYFDWFWIDADHRYSMIKRDIELWWPKVKEGGILAGHDYDRTEYNEEFVERDIGKLGDGYCHNGVIKAVNEKFGVPNREGIFWWVRKPYAS